MVKQLVKSPKKLLVFFVLLAIVLVSAFVSYREYVYQDKMALANRDVLVDGAYRDTYNWTPMLGVNPDPQMEKIFDVLPDGSGLTMHSIQRFNESPDDESARWFSHHNYYYPSLLSITGDFEYGFTYSNGKSTGDYARGSKEALAKDFGSIIPNGGSKQFSPVSIFEFFSLPEDGSIQEIYDEFVALYFSDDNFVLFYQSGKTSDYYDKEPFSQDFFFKLPESGKLIVKFEGVATTNPETVSILDGETNKTLFTRKLLFKLFEPTRKFTWGLQIRPAIETFSLTNVFVRSLGQDRTIFRGIQNE